MSDKVLDWAVRIQGIAQAGLTYGRDAYEDQNWQTRFD